MSRSTRMIGSLLAALALAAGVAGLAWAQKQLPGTQLTTHPANDLRPAWSPDGQHLAFHSARSGNNDIWVMDADGTHQQALTQDPADDRRPAWNPDGTWVAFDSDRAGTRDIWLMDAAGGQVRPLTSGPSQDTFAAWSPDGRQVAYYAYAGGVLDLWVVEAEAVLEGGPAPAPHRLTQGLADERQNQCTFACHMPGWSPDGQQIAYTGRNHSQVWLVGADGSNAHPVSGGNAHEHFPYWTADGRLLFLSERTTQEQEPVNDVWVMDPDGSNATLLYEALPHGGPLEFQIGSQTIAFHSPRGGNFDIYTTVLGEAASTPQPFVATPLADVPATAAPAVEPTAIPQVPATSVPAASAPAAGISPAVLWVAGLGLLSGGGLALYLLRRRAR